MERTEELARANEQLSRRIEEYAEAQARIERYQAQLRQLASQLAAVEARERRAIATDLHDHIGQALAFIRLNVAQLQANATFCGFEDQIAETLTLLNQTIRYTRDLTSQISPPVLYDLGLSSALQWLGETFQVKHRVLVKVEAPTAHRRLADEVSATVFKSVQELLTNVVKHAGAGSIRVRLEIVGDRPVRRRDRRRLRVRGGRAAHRRIARRPFRVVQYSRTDALSWRPNHDRLVARQGHEGDAVTTMLRECGTA